MTTPATQPSPAPTDKDMIRALFERTCRLAPSGYCDPTPAAGAAAYAAHHGEDPAVEQTIAAWLAANPGPAPR